MGLSGLFSLITAILLGLLPVLLLIGRRAAQERLSGATGRSDGTGQPAEGRAGRPPVEQPGREPSKVDRVHTPEELATFTRIIRAGREETEQYATARRARPVAPPFGTAPGVPAQSARLRRVQGRGLQPAAGGAVTAPPGESTGIRSARFAALSDLQRAVAWSEILGPPVSLRRVSGRGAIDPVE